MKRTHSLLIVEDKPLELSTYLKFAGELGLSAAGASGLSEALAYLEKRGFDFVLTDLFLSRGSDSPDGLKLIERLTSDFPSVTAMAMSSDPNSALAEKALAAGAMNFVRKPLVNADELAIALDLARDRRRLQQESKRTRAASVNLPATHVKEFPEGLIISQEQVRLLDRAARNRQIPVILVGETGTGKEEYAKLLHRKRSGLDSNSVPFVSVNCANMSEELLPAMLFGLRRSSSGSETEISTLGLVAEADGGILFLDEVHCLSKSCQRMLLRVLNDGSYQRLGDAMTLHSEFQVVCATNKNLDDEVDSDRFLLDLRTRLTGIEIPLPPLRERLQDLPSLVSLFFARANVKVKPQEMERLVKRCAQFYWRGNIRQLFKALEVLLVLSEDEPDGQIRATNLPLFKTMLEPSAHAEEEAKTSTSVARPKVEERHPILAQLGDALQNDKPFNKIMSEVEKSIIECALQRHKYNLSKVCLGLQIPRSSLDLKRKRYDFS